nr:L-arabinose isomerase [bacterium]
MFMKQVWFITGSQHLYGDETLRQVAADAREIAAYLDAMLPVDIHYVPPVTTQEEISAALGQAQSCPDCIGIMVWMHTFSPARMWIAGLTACRKPILHFHTQYHQALPYANIDMDYMNLHQSAHGDREHASLYARMRKARKVVVGHWKDEEALRRIECWISAAIGLDASQGLRVARLGDNMRDVAVTEGDKVAAQMQLGFSTNGYGIGDLVDAMACVTEAEIDALMEEYQAQYTFAEGAAGNPAAVREQARFEIALERFCAAHGAGAFTTTFEDLHGLCQLPGLAVQRLMGKGYGFGAEGDWKSAALCRIMKQMAGNRATAFMEDYTYDLVPGQQAVLGAHMLEVCPTIAGGPIQIDVQPLSIGGRNPPARMIFEARTGPAVAACLVDLGDRFRLLAAKVECIPAPQPMPRLPVAHAMWRPLPDFTTGIQAWLMAGGGHHTVLSFAVTTEQLQDFARMAGIECIVIDEGLTMDQFENQLLLGDCIWSGRRP